MVDRDHAWRWTLFLFGSKSLSLVVQATLQATCSGRSRSGTVHVSWGKGFLLQISRTPSSNLQVCSAVALDGRPSVGGGALATVALVWGCAPACSSSNGNARGRHGRRRGFLTCWPDLLFATTLSSVFFVQKEFCQFSDLFRWIRGRKRYQSLP